MGRVMLTKAELYSANNAIYNAVTAGQLTLEEFVKQTNEINDTFTTARQISESKIFPIGETAQTMYRTLRRIINDQLLVRVYLDMKNGVIQVSGKDNVNGDVYLYHSNGDKKNTVVCKVAKSRNADPVEYEFGVGRLVNYLRAQNSGSFALTYGITKSIFKTGRFALLTEFIPYDYTSPRTSDYAMSLGKYIGTHGKTPGASKVISDILVYLLLALHHAGTVIQFTHYDLHTENILLTDAGKTQHVEYSLPDGTKVNPKYIPVIIDYGRAHVNPKIIDSSPEIMPITHVYPDGRKVVYSSFEKYQKEIWAQRFFLVSEGARGNQTISACARHIADLVEEGDTIKKLAKVYNKRVQHAKDVYNLYYRDPLMAVSNKRYKGMFYDFNIHPDRFHMMYDTFRLVASICDTMNTLTNDMRWTQVFKRLTDAYPLYIPGPYTLAMESGVTLDPTLKTPVGVAKLIFDTFSTQSGSGIKYHTPGYPLTRHAILPTDIPTHRRIP